VTRCSLVAGAVASGEPLSDAEREHVKGCPDCAALVALPSALARTAHGAEPGLGFSARMQVGARARITARRRRRVSLSVLGTVAAAVMIVFGVQQIRHHEHAERAAHQGGGNHLPVTLEESARARTLLEQTRFDRAMKPAGPWSEIEADLRHDVADLVHQRHRSSGEKP
jgi:hypothetical protein